MPKIRFKRGLEEKLPLLSEGEPGFTTDTEKLFIGASEGNVEFAKKKDVDINTSKIAEHTSTLENLSHVDANAEMLEARGTYPVLGDRLDDVTTQLAEKATQSAVALKADKSYVDTQITNIGNASPKGTYATLTALQTAFPTGTTGIYVVTADGKWYYWSGSAWTAGGVYQATGIADGSVTETKYASGSLPHTAIKGGYIDKSTSYNIYNKVNALDKMLIMNNPASPITTYNDSIFSGLFPVTSGKTYLITQPSRAIGVIFAWGAGATSPFNTNTICAEQAAGTAYGSWLLDKTKMSRVNKISALGYNAVELTINDPNIKFIGWHMHSDSYWVGHTTTDFNNLINATQVVEGTTEKAYQAYGDFYKLKDVALPDAVSNLMLNLGTVIRKNFVINKTGTQISVRVKWDDSNDLYHLWEYPRIDVNTGLALKQIYTCGSSLGFDKVTGTLYKESSDDVTPVQLNIGYIGGNHGFNYAYKITATGHGKTNVDIGSIWTIESKNFIVVDIIDANTLKLIGDDTGDPTFPAYTFTSASGTFTHVSGATNTSNISFTSKVTDPLYNTNNKTTVLVLDGKEITVDGIYQGDKFDIVEKYNIFGIQSFQAFLKARVGGSTKPNLQDDTLSPWITVTNVFTHGRNGSLTIKTGYEFFLNSTISSYGCIQAQTIGNKAYVPGVGIVDGKDMSTVVTQGTNDLAFVNTSWLDPNKPPYRYHQFTNDLSQGMALGYNTSYGVAKPSIRKLNTNAGNFNGSTKKMYPIVKYGGSAVAGDYQEAIAFRVPLRVIDTDATCLYWYWVGNDIYLAFDYHKNINKTIQLPSYLAGKKIEQLDIHANTTVQSEIVSAKGIKVKVINNYGYGVLRLYD